MNHRLFLSLFALLALLPVSACITTEEDPEEEASSIRAHIQDELVGEIEAQSTDGGGGVPVDLSGLEMYLCRRGSLSDRVFSLRSFEGRLCESTYVDGLDLVGGAALLICWDGNLDDFQDSHCADNALDEYGLDTYDQEAVMSQMQARIEGYIAAAGGGAAYQTAKLLFCAIPSSLLGPASSLHDLWCGA